jgi:hypothetical protein
MNKFLLITLLAIISLNCFTAQKSSVAKDFLTGFFKTFDEKFSIDACMGEPITDSLNHLLEDLREKKINAVIEDFKILIDAVNKNCPVEDVKSYINAKKAAIEEGYYFENLKKNYLKVGNIVIIEVNNKDRSAYSIGVACAEIEKLLIFKEQIRHLTFLALPDFPKLPELPKFPEINMDLEGFKKFFKGVLEGVSSVPFEKNICYTSTVDIKIEDVKALFDKLSKSIQDRSAGDFYTSILEVLKLLNKLNDANKNCNISALIKSIGVYATPYAGVAKLIYNIASNYSVYYDDITAAYTDLTNMDWQKSGADTGRILSTLLGWKTS